MNTRSPKNPAADNPAGRSSIHYRRTDYGASLQRMLGRLAPRVAGLSAQHRDDPTVALLDACAIVTDILSFYQERIANEGYLRTATERFSVVELARHVYELDCGVAASTEIAFTVEEDAGEITIASGTRLLSLPLPGAGPETFETTASITARAAFNHIALAPLSPALADAETSRLRSSDLPEDALSALRGRRIALTGTVDNRPAVETATIAEVSRDGLVTLAAPLQHRFDGETMSGNANLAPATHGETVEQHLQGARGTRSGQHFTLLRSPLSFLPSPTGPTPCLTVHVQGVRWQRVASLDDVDENFPGYMVRIGDNGTTTLIFGDGVHGARLPSTATGVVVTYRVGLGKVGNLAAGRISLLPDPPTGVRAAENPLPSSGGRDPDTLEQAKERAEYATRVGAAPITARELEDAVWTSGEVSKVKLRRLALPGVPQLVHITVAGKDWHSPEPGAVPITLCAALERKLAQIAPSPGRRYWVAPYTPYACSIVLQNAALVFDPGADASEVREQAIATLRQQLSSEHSEFGQTLHTSQIDAILRQVPGLLSYRFSLFGRGEEAVQSVTARGAHIAPDGSVAPAELLSMSVVLHLEPT